MALPDRLAHQRMIMKSEDQTESSVTIKTLSLQSANFALIKQWEKTGFVSPQHTCLKTYQFQNFYFERRPL